MFPQSGLVKPSYQEQINLFTIHHLKKYLGESSRSFKLYKSIAGQGNVRVHEK